MGGAASDVQAPPHRLAVAVAILAWLPACGQAAKGDGSWSGLDAGAASSAPLPPLTTAWCGSGWLGLDGSTCLALPERFASPASLVIFAHGILAPGALPTHDQAMLLAAARKHGFAVLFARGTAGLCDWDAGVSDHACWPTRRRTVDDAGPAIFAAWANGQARAEDSAGVRFERRYLVGFSNGGYFVAYVALEGRFPIAGAGVVGAGRTAIDETLSGPAHPPFYLAVGDAEASGTRQDAANLAHVLALRGWPVTSVVHAGRGHEMDEDDLALAWAAWGR
jgi:predicted esterase